MFLFFAACAAPDLGDTPFLCGEGGSCPTGYSCMQDVCVRDGAQPPQMPDAMTHPQPDASTSSNLDAPTMQPDAARPDAQTIPDAARTDALPTDAGSTPDAVITPDASGGGSCQRTSECGAGLCCGWSTNTCVSPNATAYCLCDSNSECTQPNTCCDRDFGFCLDRSLALCGP
jgi:hypothetical protein